MKLFLPLSTLLALSQTQHAASFTPSARNGRNAHGKSGLQDTEKYLEGQDPAAATLLNNNNIKGVLPKFGFAEYVAESKLPTAIGHFVMRGYSIPGAPIGHEPCVIYSQDKPPMGTAQNPAHSVPVRVHDQCMTSEVFGSKRSDAREQFEMSLSYIQEHGGCIVYLQQEGRGVGLANKIAASALQDEGMDTLEAFEHLGFGDDQRDYTLLPSILKDMGIASIELLTNSPQKVQALEAANVKIESTIPAVVPAVNRYNRDYLETKHEKLNHDNLAPLLNVQTKEKKQDSTHMMPRRSTAPADDAEEGVKARDDGYCFGRESVEAAIAAMADGEMVVVVDDMDRENEGDFIMAADQCTPRDMAQIIRYSSGVICLALESERLEQLGLPAMVTNNEDPKGTAFTVTVDATKEHGITTGISASDRAKTVNLLADPTATAADFHRPGHILPLRSREGGVLTRDGHTEAAVDLSRLAGREPAGVLCEIVSEENPVEMMRLPEIKRFCKRHGYVLTSIVDLAQYRMDENL